MANDKIQTTISFWEEKALLGLSACLWGRRIFCRQSTFDKIIKDTYLKLVTEREEEKEKESWRHQWP